MSSIRNRVLAALLVAGLIPLLIIITVTQTLTSRAIRKSEYVKITEIGESVASGVKTVMDAAWNDLQNLRTNPTLNDPSSTEEQKRAEFIRIADSYPHFSDIILYEKTGYLHVSKLGEKTSVERDRTSWLSDAARGHEAVAGPLIPPNITGSPKLEVLYYIPVGKIGNEPERFVVKAVFDFSRVVWPLIDAFRIRGFRAFHSSRSLQ